MKTSHLIALLLFITTTSYAQEIDYQKIQADEYFKVGRYNDAFFVYLDLARGNSDLKNYVKNTSHAMYLTKKFRDYRSFRKYELAKSHLRELIELNPSDPNRRELSKISVEEADEYLRYALRQETIDASIHYFDRAIENYQEAINEGSTDDSLERAIAICRWAKAEMGYGERRTHESGIR
jgi:tetratricopeptide (TPR) repeat protein